MRVRGYGARPSNNGYSGHQNSGDEYNRDYKQVRYTRAEEYATRNTKEYHHYPEQKDLTKDDDRKEDTAQKESQKKKNSSRSHLQAIQQIAVALAGSAIVATSYQTAMAKRAEKQVDDPTSSTSQTTDIDLNNAVASWEWSEDNKQAVLVLSDSLGNVIARIPAEVTTSEEEAKCTLPGKITYTATASSEVQTYTDTREEETPPLGHDFDSGTETTLENGASATDFECNRCGEHFIIQNELEEE